MSWKAGAKGAVMGVELGEKGETKPVTRKREKHGRGAGERRWVEVGGQGTQARKGCGLTTLPASINLIKVLKIRSHVELST